MKIEKIKIKNYKSIKDIEIIPSKKVNVFIGENSTGKSNIFNAITWPLGPVYPSFNSTSKEDRFKGRDENKIEITLEFDDRNYLQLSEEWYLNGYLKSGLNLNGSYANNEQREKYISSFIDVDREISDYMPSNKWSLMGRFLQDVNNKFNSESITDPETGETILKSKGFKDKLVNLRNDYLFSVKDDDGKNIMNEFVKVLQKETAAQLNRPEDNFNIDLNLYDPWNFYKTLQLNVHETDLDLDFRASELGMGVQASITIAILKAYSKIKLNNDTPIFIDEPELFLHPHGRRNFYKIIRELADSGTQIFLTTHSTEFVDLGNFDEIFVVRKDRDIGTYIKTADPERFKKDLLIRKNINADIDSIKLAYKNAYENTGDSQKASEAMFAKKIILVEGESESLILPYFFNLLEFDYIANGISIVKCGGKSELDRFYRLYTEYGIPCYIMFDGDSNYINTDEEEETANKNKDILSLFGIEDVCFPATQVNDLFLSFKNNLNDNLGFEDVPSQKGLKLYKYVKSNINTKEEVPDWGLLLVEKIINLPWHPTSVLKEN